MSARENASFNIVPYIKFIIYCIIFVSSLGIIAQLSTNMYGSDIFEAMLTLSLAIFAAMTSSEAYRKYEQSKNERKINHIEKSLENFYLPLQTMFDREWNDYTILDYYTNNKEKYENIRNYVYLAEKGTRELFMIHPKTNDELKDLLEQVKQDIRMYQDELDDLIK